MVLPVELGVMPEGFESADGGDFDTKGDVDGVAIAFLGNPHEVTNDSGDEDDRKNAIARRFNLESTKNGYELSRSKISGFCETGGCPTHDAFEDYVTEDVGDGPWGELMHGTVCEVHWAPLSSLLLNSIGQALPDREG